jgi:hypothetical protein
MAHSPEITAARLRELLSYDPETGELRWRQPVGRRVKAGDLAGCCNADGYVVIGIFGRIYRAHRLAWLWMRGCWPGVVDHRDGDRSNNRFKNLRDASLNLNAQNQHQAHRNSKTGVLGVDLHKGRYRAQIRSNGRKRFLGAFDSLEQAGGVYSAAKADLHEGVHADGSFT